MNSDKRRTLISRKTQSSAICKRSFGMGWLLTFMLFVVALEAAQFVSARGQDLNWDLMNYHFYTGYALLHGRYAYDIAAAGLQSFLHPATNVLAYLSLRHLPFPFSGWSILLIQLTSFPAIALIARLVGLGLGYQKVSLAHVLAVGLCLFAPLWWSELGTTFFSSWIAPAMLWGCYLLLRCFYGPVTRFNLIVAGVLFGFSAGLKLTNAPFAVAAFCVLLMLYDGDRGLLLRRVLLFITGGALGFLLTAWWYVYLWAEWKNPLFPLYNAIFASPYYDLENYRDIRWKFFSMREFMAFLYQSAQGTGKTSEIIFADVRILLISALIPFAVLAGFLKKNAEVKSRLVTALLVFVGISFALWALLFAYQRYLIPAELLLGLVIWILLSRLLARESLRVIALAGLVVLSAVTLKIPDWGHARVDTSARKPFSLVLPDKLAHTPARYLVVGAPVSYILPYLHRDSVFYGLNFSAQSKTMIGQRLHEPSSLPLRVLAQDRDLPQLWQTVEQFGYTPASHSFDCSYLTTAAGRYSVCELIAGRHSVESQGVLVNAAFAESDLLQKKGVLWESGFSYPESWGRWTDGQVARIALQACLPQGTLRVSVTARAYGANLDQPVYFQIGSQQATARFGEAVSNTSVYLDNDQECADTLTLHLPAVASAAASESGSDSRKLGLGLTRIEIIKE